MSSAKVTVREFERRKHEGEPIVVLTAYEALTARVLTEAGVEFLLVGDSLGNVILGHRDTLPVTLEVMLHHTRAVRRGAPEAFVIGDMPFLSYQVSTQEAVRNAGRFLQEAGADAVKVEGGSRVAETIEALVSTGIPVMGHLGLTPQSHLVLGGHRVQANDAAGARDLRQEARALQDAGAFAVVLECVPREVAAAITSESGIPTIGIGAGPDCDGQVLVTQDLLGFGTGKTPRFVRRYADLEGAMKDAVRKFREDVRERSFPADEESFHLSPAEREGFEQSGGGSEGTPR